MKYYVAADGGGTKLLALLYDEEFHVVRSARMTGTNSTQISCDQIREKMERLVEQLIPPEITELEGADLSVLRYEELFLEVLGRRCSIRQYKHRGNRRRRWHPPASGTASWPSPARARTRF